MKKLAVILGASVADNIGAVNDYESRQKVDRYRFKGAKMYGGKTE